MWHFSLSSSLGAKELESHNISVRVINWAIVTVEEHQITGGLGGAVAEIVSENYHVPLKRVGVQDRFGESGEPNELLEKFGLSKDAIIKAVTHVLRMKEK